MSAYGLCQTFSIIRDPRDPCLLFTATSSLVKLGGQGQSHAQGITGRPVEFRVAVSPLCCKPSASAEHAPINGSSPEREHTPMCTKRLSANAVDPHTDLNCRRLLRIFPSLFFRVSVQLLEALAGH
jgi:hypothetical protein